MVAASAGRDGRPRRTYQRWRRKGGAQLEWSISLPGTRHATSMSQETGWTSRACVKAALAYATKAAMLGLRWVSASPRGRRRRHPEDGGEPVGDRRDATRIAPSVAGIAGEVLLSDESYRRVREAIDATSEELTSRVRPPRSPLSDPGGRENGTGIGLALAIPVVPELARMKKKREQVILSVRLETMGRHAAGQLTGERSFVDPGSHHGTAYVFRRLERQGRSSARERSSGIPDLTSPAAVSQLVEETGGRKLWRPLREGIRSRPAGPRSAIVTGDDDDPQIETGKIGGQETEASLDRNRAVSRQ